MDFFDSFLQKYQLILPPNVFQSCRDGLKFMAKGVDGVHTDQHVKDLLELLDEFLTDKKNRYLKSKIDFQVLLLSVIWHDIWKSRQITSNPFKLLYNQVAEGLGSMRIFSRYAPKYHLEKSLIKKVKYAIRKHSELQLLPIRGLEAKLLYNLDTLETFSASRLRHAVETLTSQKKVGPLTTRLANLYIRYYKYPKSRLTFMPWAKTKLDSSKADFFAQAKQLTHDLFFFFNRQKRKPFIQKVQDYLKRRFQHKVE